MSFLYFLESIRNPVLDFFFSAITHLGSETLFMAIAIAVFWCYSKKDGLYLLATGFFGTLINQFLKLVCQVPRPWVKDPNFTIVESARADATGYSFPSGHTQSVTASMGCTARFSKNKWIRIVCIVLAALVALSRMYLGVHTPADVLVSLGIGIVLVFALYPIFQKSDKNPALLYGTIGALTALCLAYVLFVELHTWPADIDPHNLEHGIKNGYLLFGCGCAMLLALWIEDRFIRFDTKAPLTGQILKVVLGLVLVLGIKAGLKPIFNAIFGGHLAANALRYFCIVIFAVCVWPLTFKWFAKGCPMKKWVKKTLIIIGCVLLALALVAGFIFWDVTRDTPNKPVSTENCTNPLITPLGKTMLSSHRAGGDFAPENTMKAFKDIIEGSDYTVDIFEFDIHLTKDGDCVLLHDDTLDRTSNSEQHFGAEGVRPEDKTLAELKQLNMGEGFTDADGNNPYDGLTGDAVPADLKIITLSEALEYLESKGSFRYIIEIKSSGAEGEKTADRLYNTLKDMDLLDRAVIGTFHNEITDYMDKTYPDMLRSAGFNECIKFYLYCYFNIDADPDTWKFSALQIPTTDYVVNLGTSRVINYAHKYNIAVQYWTINDTDEMKRLQSIGADAIMTDIPHEGAKVINRP
ncbi:MAG: phosphatase PAP2 family protein [Clostridia bacterium]|nr:phosphatase PAP2 family protein [Clostridia bacterium]